MLLKKLLTLISKQHKQKQLLKKRDALVSELKADLEKLKKENDALQEKAEDKPRRGRPKKKKVDDPLA